MRRSTRARPRRRRRGARVLLGVAAFVVVLGGAVAAVVAMLDHREPEEPVVARCVADVDGTPWSLSPDQAQNAALFAAVAARRGLPARAVTIAIATAMQESRLENIDYGDRDSIGLFQQRPSQGWGTVEEIMDPVYSTGRFYDGLVKVRGYEDMEVTDAAQAVQRSAFPKAYAQHEARARAWASALTGYSPEAIACTLPPVDARAGRDGTSSTADASGTSRALERFVRDFGETPVDTTSAADDTPATLVIHTDRIGDGSPRQAFAVASWAVATAHELDVVSVTVGGRTWDRTSGTWGAAPAPAPVGAVTITL